MLTQMRHHVTSQGHNEIINIRLFIWFCACTQLLEFSVGISRVVHLPLDKMADNFGRWQFRMHFLACRRCSNYIFILHLTPCFNILRKDNDKPKWETFWVLGFGAPYIRDFLVIKKSHSVPVPYPEMCTWKSSDFHSRKQILKCWQQNGGQFGLASMIDMWTSIGEISLMPVILK